MAHEKAIRQLETKLARQELAIKETKDLIAALKKLV